MASPLSREFRSARVLGVLVAGVMLAAVGGGTAHAYCRETVSSASSGPCIEEPGAKRLKWTRTCMRYVFNKQMFSLMPLLTEKQIRKSFETSFQTWADVDCKNGRAPFFAEQDSGTTKTDAAEFLFDADNESIVAAYTRADWAALGNDDNALALTLLWHNSKTGTILDVDMEFNTGAGRFADCEKQSCGRDMMDLQNTVTHEAGHVLGLGHSDIDGSTMIDDALDAETSKRTLEADDRKGYCSLDLPEFVCENDDCTCEPPEQVKMTMVASRCAVSAPGGQSTNRSRTLPIVLFSLVLGMGLHRGARRRRSATLRPAHGPQRVRT